MNIRRLFLCLTAGRAAQATESQQGYVKAGTAYAGDQHGFAVAIPGDTMVVGAPEEDGNGRNCWRQ